MNKLSSSRGWVAVALGVVTSALGAAKLVASAMMGQSAFMEFKTTYAGEPLYFFCRVVELCRRLGDEVDQAAW